MKKKIIFIINILILFSILTGCRELDNNAKIENIKFDEKNKSIFIGDIVTIGMLINPTEAKNAGKIEYSVSQEGIIDIKKESGNDGLIIEALSRGSVVITANFNGKFDYCNIIVDGNGSNIIPYIIIPENVIEMNINQRKNITVSIAGGTPLDNSSFIWSYKSQNVVNIESTGNIAIIDSKNLGEAVVTISHPKAQYSVDVLIYVLGTDEVPVYITSELNVIKFNEDLEEFNFFVDLKGGTTEDNGSFVYEVTSGNDIISLTGNGRKGTIIPKKDGIALITVYHYKASHPFKIQVIVNKVMEFKYIEVDKTFILMELGDSNTIQVNFNGEAPDDVNNKYSIELSENGIINIVNTHNVYFINAISIGRTILKIKNDYADFSREILIIVTDLESRIIDSEKYINTSQNVITMELGGNDSILKMLLVGGNEADKNSFSWYVDDSTIISVDTGYDNGYGNVIYDRLPNNRSMISSNYEEVEAFAIISAKNTGTARIVVQHPKAKNESHVIVKIYPKNTFSNVPIVLGGSPYYKVPRNKNVEVNLFVETGDRNNVGNIEWEIESSEIATSQGSGLKGIINGHKTGVTTLKVKGGNLKQQFTAVVVVADENELKDQKFIYVSNPNISLVKNQSVLIKILNENMTGDEIRNLYLINENTDKISAILNDGLIVLTALDTGMSEIIIRGIGTNDIRIAVFVEENSISIEKPYYLNSSKSIIGVVKNETIEYDVDLIGGNSKQEGNIIWNNKNENVISIIGNGKKVRITGKTTGQAVIEISHPKSANKLELVIYVVNEGTSVEGKIVLFLEKTHYLIEKNETIFFTLKTNATDTQKRNLEWNIDGFDIAEMNVGADKITVFVRGIKEGVANIKVSHIDQVISQNVFISVVSDKKGVKHIGVPSIVEAVKGNNLNITAITENLNNGEISNITWTVIRNSSILKINGNGDSCLLQPNGEGNATIRVENESLQFIKDIVVYIYSSYEELASSYIMGASTSYYRIDKGDIVNLSLVFGSKGFPEHEKDNIAWSVSIPDGNVVEIVSRNGQLCVVKGLNSGIARIEARSSIASNNIVYFEIEVNNVNIANDNYRFFINENDKIKGIEVGKFVDVVVKIYNGDKEVKTGLSNILCVADDNSVINITTIDNTIRFTAKAKGQTYVTVSDLSKRVKDDLKIFIYTANSETELNNYFPISFDKINYLIYINETVKINVNTINNDVNKLNKLSYECENNNDVIKLIETGKKEINITALNKGNEVINVKYNGETVQRIYISVTNINENNLSTYLITENIIGMLVGETYETKVNTNNAYKGLIFWKMDYSSDPVVELSSSNGETAFLRGIKKGEAYLNVSINGIERRILVFVCETEHELRNYDAINIDQLYYIIEKGKTLNLNIKNYNGNILGITEYSDFYNNNFNNIIDVNINNNRNIVIKTKNEGIAAIRINNNYYNFNTIIYVEVRNNDSGNINNISMNNYISTSKNLYIIGLEEKNVPMYVHIIGDNSYTNYLEWSDYDRDLIELIANGSEAIINPKKSGQTIIKVRNMYCDNELEITVIIGDRFNLENRDDTYIYVEKVINEYTIVDGTDTVFYEIRNDNNINYNKLLFDKMGNSVNVNYTNYGRLIVTPNEVGITRVTINYGDVVKTDIYFIVRSENIGSNNVKYLTTSENFIIAGINEIRSTDINLVGYNENDSNNFIWTISNDTIAKVIGNGTRGQIYTLQEGEAVITVSHKSTNYPLEINLKVTKSKNENLIYLTTQQNVIETIESEVSGYIYIQKIGGDQSNTNSTWTVDNPSIISVTGQGFSGIYTAKKEGTALITVTNNEIQSRPLKIVVIVKKPNNSGMYIISNETLLEMRPGVINNRIVAELVGGSDQDKRRFSWMIYYQNPTDIEVAKNNGNVITIVFNEDQCNINAINEGTARIRVSHDKADNPLYITVRVTKYGNVEFAKSEVQLVAGFNEFVGVNIPTYENFNNKVIYMSDNPEVVDVLGINNSLLLKAKSKGYAIVKAWINGKDEIAEIYVNVVSDIEPEVQRIVIGRTSYLLNPRSAALRLTANIQGEGIIESELDNIEWIISNTNIIDMFPKEGKGREVQIAPKGVEGSAYITIKHNKINEKYWKTISIEVSDDNDFFTLDNNKILITNNTSTKIKATITDGREHDYNAIEWWLENADPEGYYNEIVRIMGDGREILLYPISDGIVYVHARYKNLWKVCEVEVRSPYHFSFNVQNIKLYPGSPDTEVQFELRPPNADVLWYVSDEYVGSCIEYLPSISEKILRVKGIKLGKTQIIGISNGKKSTLNVNVTYDYSLMVDTYKPINLQNINRETISYTVFPPTTTIGIEGIDPSKYEIIQPNSNGVGTIIFYITDETQRTELTVKQYNNDVHTGQTRFTVVEAGFDPKEKPIPYFLRYAGEWSNTNNINQIKPTRNKPYVSNYTNKVLGEEITKLNNGNYQLIVGDGEEHYILFDKRYKNSYMRFNDLLEFGSEKNITPSNLYSQGLRIHMIEFDDNGDKVPAIKISGGKDEIVYDRVMFNNSLRMDVSSNYVGNANVTSTSNTINKWIGTTKLERKTTEKVPETVDLWHKYDSYIYGYDNYYFYLEEQYYEIINDNTSEGGNFIKSKEIDDFDKANINALYKYASKEGKYFAQYSWNVVYYTVPKRKNGYFYSAFLVESTEYNDLFDINNMVKIGDDYISSTSTAITQYKDIYETVDFYIYLKGTKDVPLTQDFNKTPYNDFKDKIESINNNGNLIFLTYEITDKVQIVHNTSTVENISSKNMFDGTNLSYDWSRDWYLDNMGDMNNYKYLSYGGFSNITGHIYEDIYKFENKWVWRTYNNNTNGKNMVETNILGNYFNSNDKNLLNANNVFEARDGGIYVRSEADLKSKGFTDMSKNYVIHNYNGGHNQGYIYLQNNRITLVYRTGSDSGIGGYYDYTNNPKFRYIVHDENNSFQSLAINVPNSYSDSSSYYVYPGEKIADLSSGTGSHNSGKWELDSSVTEATLTNTPKKTYKQTGVDENSTSVIDWSGEKKVFMHDKTKTGTDFDKRDSLIGDKYLRFKILDYNNKLNDVFNRSKLFLENPDIIFNNSYNIYDSSKGVSQNYIVNKILGNKLAIQKYINDTNHYSLKPDGSEISYTPHNYFINSDIWVSNDFVWNNDGNKHIVDINFMTKFPFTLYETGYYPYKENSVPMPSIDVNVTNNNSNSETIYIKYSLFGKPDNFITLEIIYEKRNSHHLYKGDANIKLKSEDRGNVNIGGGGEIQGVNDWSKVKETDEGSHKYEEE